MAEAVLYPTSSMDIGGEVLVPWVPRAPQAPSIPHCSCQSCASTHEISLWTEFRSRPVRHR